MKIKLVIWDLDETLWQGTLAEGDQVQLFEHRANIVKVLNQCGIVSSVCSKNDPNLAKQALQEMGLWGEFVFPRIAFAPKGQAVKQIIEDMQLRAANVLFVDDNPHNLHEAQTLLPELHVANATLPECDEILCRILDDNKHVSKSRVEEYRILQTKLEDRNSASQSNEEFLRSCDIHVTASGFMDNLEFAGRIEELINRSNQLNYTGSRVESGAIATLTIDVQLYEPHAVFAWDKYGYYGLIGFAAIERATKKLIHFVFSCRVMHMGLENWLLRKLKEKYPSLITDSLTKPLPELAPDWIHEESFTNDGARHYVLSKELASLEPNTELRIIFECQSAGIAHYSRWRNIIDFDNYPRVFRISSLLEDSIVSKKFPPFLVYGPGGEYRDSTWPQSMTLTPETYSLCVTKFCAFLDIHNIRMLVVLPPENAPDEKYYPLAPPPVIHTRERAIELNAVWKECAAQFEGITLLELDSIIQPSDMHDASHYYAGFLKQLSTHIDGWYEQNSGDASALETKKA